VVERYVIVDSSVARALCDSGIAQWVEHWARDCGKLLKIALARYSPHYEIEN